MPRPWRVLVRICQSFEEAVSRANLDWRGLPFEPWEHAIVATWHEGKVSNDDFFAELSEHTGGVYTPAEVRRIAAAWVIGPYEGTEALVKDLQQHYTVALLSNANALHWAHFGDWPAALRIRHRVASHVVHAVKPHPKAYRHVVDLVGVRPTLFFDDTAANVEAAIEFGWLAHRIDPLGDPVAQIRGKMAEFGPL